MREDRDDDQAPLPAGVVEWVLRAAQADSILGVGVESLDGGAVSARVERLDVQVRARGTVESVQLVRKWGLPHELAGLRAAQVVRPEATAVPELIAYGHDESGPWMITPFYGGASDNMVRLVTTGVDAGALPAALFDSLARLHTRYLRHGPSNRWRPCG